MAPSMILQQKNHFWFRLDRTRYPTGSRLDRSDRPVRAGFQNYASRAIVETNPSSIVAPKWAANLCKSFSTLIKLEETRSISSKRSWVKRMIVMTTFKD
ncbi:hypothetical protein MTR_4g068730 [Medicago truncatula]|uniref:Uncharacterized protein n=1 Tax=Medicago truncatula TaxID=3880 RepID=A0A072UMW8_MEDTR|nr:hypothetical protein MTR_4g068730 [Medicago truncatula]